MAYDLFFTLFCYLRQAEDSSCTLDFFHLICAPHRLPIGNEPHFHWYDGTILSLDPTARQGKPSSQEVMTPPKAWSTKEDFKMNLTC